MKVLSLFDGISCGRVALGRAGISVEEYYASEIDKYAIKIAQANYPDTIQLGDINNWRTWDINWADIDLIIGGSPCQSFSTAGRGEGFAGKSGLVTCFVDIVTYAKERNPNVKFLLENVKMRKEYAEAISNLLGVTPVLINSNLFSAQNRQRLYWFNWAKPGAPTPSKAVIADILEGEVDEVKYQLTKKHLAAFLRNYKWRHCALDEKSKPILASYYKQPAHCPYIPCQNSESGYRRLTPIECERLQTLPDNYTSVGGVFQPGSAIKHWEMAGLSMLFPIFLSRYN